MNLNSMCYVTVSGNREGLGQMLFQATILVSDVKASYQAIKTNTYVQIYILQLQFHRQHGLKNLNKTKFKK